MVKGTKAVGYTRVSTAAQGESGHGLAAQEAAIRKECEHRGWPLLAMHRDVVSSGKEHRPALEAAMAEAKEHGAVLVASAGSRFARSVPELRALHDRAAAEGWWVLSLDMAAQGLDTTRPLGKFMLNILGAVAEFERDLIRERTREALAAAKAGGTVLGRRPALAVMDVKDAHAMSPERRARAEAERARMEAALPRLLALREQGASLRTIAAALNDEGLRGAQGGRWTANSVMNALRRYQQQQGQARRGG